MKKVFISLLLALCPLMVFAQQKVALVNSQEILTSMQESKDAQTRLQELDQKYTKELQTMQDEYTKKTEQFVNEQAGLSDAIKKSRQQELIDMQNRIQQSANVMQQDIQKQQEALFAPIQQKVSEAIKKVSDAEGITYVVDSSLMLYVGKGAIDLTPKIKAQLGIK